MAGWRLQSAAEQVASYLRQGLEEARWEEVMPGVYRLVDELGVSRKTVEAALRLLEREGLLVPQGAGRRRRIMLSEGEINASALRVAVLRYERENKNLPHMVDLMHELEEAGHVASFTPEALLDLRMDVQRVAELVERTPADAWVVSAASRDVLEWFSSQDLPAFALFGRRRGLPLAAAGPNKVAAFAAVARRLVELGHRRIVLVTRRMRRLPVPGQPEQAFLNELAAQGIPITSYNLPDWEDSKEGFQTLLDSLFQVTPPTALLIDEAYQLVAAQQFFMKRGLRVPDDVSLVCCDGDPTFAWCEPSIAHIRWDYQPVVRRIVRWATNVSRDVDDRHQTLTKAELVAGGTIGPAA